MPSHLSSIGLPVADEREFAALPDRVGPSSTPIEVPGGVYWKWTSECGAELWLQADAANSLVGLTPAFAGRGRVRVALTDRVARPQDTPLEGAFRGWADPQDADPESGAYPFVFDAVDAARHASLDLPVVVETQIAAFAREISAYPTLAAYEASQSGEIKFASRSFIPSGLFSPDDGPTDPPSSTAIFTGHVLAAEVKTNPLTGATFHWALVDTLGGTFDVLVDPAILDGPIDVGGVVTGSFRLCGRLIS